MTAHLGNLALWLAAAAAAWTVASCMLAGFRRREQWLALARAGLVVVLAALLLASGTLVAALLLNDLRLDYVAGHSSASTPAIYRLAAMWSGHEGSLLLWATLAAGLSSLFVLNRRARTEPGEGVTLATLATTCGFFSVVLLAGASPFTLRAHALAGDGHGLNPLLQHWAMAVHPPTLFIGYAASLIPFARLIGALAARQSDGSWMQDIRSWALLAWLALGAGIALGARWAYVELGWGGYWAWDPVENASLLPWLTCTGLVHTLKAEANRHRWGRWAALLCALTFLLCILGTYLTRSGAVQSVHAFGQSALGVCFLAFLGFASLAALVLLLMGRPILRPAIKTPSPTPRDGLIALANVLLLVMAATILVGTLAPVFSGWFSRTPVAVASSYYHRLVIPLAIACIALMVIAPLVGRHRPAASDRPSRTRSGLLRPAVMLAHGGVLLMAFGIAGSSLLGLERSAELQPGESLVIGRYTLRFDDVRQVRGPDYAAVQATITLREPNGAPGRVLQPERRFSDLDRQATSEVAIRSTLRDDLYITLAGWEPGGTRVAIQARVLPLTIWIWIGAATAFAGTGLCLLRRLDARRRLPLSLTRAAQATTAPAALAITAATSPAGAPA